VIRKVGRNGERVQEGCSNGEMRVRGNQFKRSEAIIFFMQSKYSQFHYVLLALTNTQDIIEFDYRT
jgi:hypothetical protein